jgi:hypothetical protein
MSFEYGIVRDCVGETGEEPIGLERFEETGELTGDPVKRSYRADSGT